MELRPHQKKAIADLKNGRVLHGAVGSGKSLTAIAYYVENEAPKPIYVITTAKKRNSLEWQQEAARFGIGEEMSVPGFGKIVIDSWNNIAKYEGVEDAFFIFDEQRLVSSGGKWVKSFYKIAKRNRWILLSGTPGDTWLDYAPVFIANGWYRNITDFREQHVEFKPFTKFPQIKRFVNEHKLEMMRNELLVEMPFERHTTRIINEWPVDHDRDAFKRVYKDRWNVYDDRPIEDINEMFRLMRKVVNDDATRLDAVKEIQKGHPKLIVFYNFDFELDALRTLAEYNNEHFQFAEYNGHRKQPIPDTEEWIYAVQYLAGAEGWNCIETNAMVFYSLTYSYRAFEQAMGRIDRLNTPFMELFYFLLVSDSEIDRRVKKKLDAKESFNERKEATSMGLFNVVHTPDELEAKYDRQILAILADPPKMKKPPGQGRKLVARY